MSNRNESVKGNEMFSWNVYIPMKSLNTLEFNFYKDLYSYRLYCRTMASKNEQYKGTSKYKELQDMVNLSYEKIKNLSGVEKNEDGEYDYPNVAYKKRTVENSQGNKETMFFICVSGTDMIKKFRIEDVVFYIPLFSYGSIKSLPVKGSKFEHVYMEEYVGGLCSYFKEHLNEISKNTNINTCIELVKWIQKFPSSALYEVNFGTSIDKHDLEAFLPKIGHDSVTEKKGA